MVFVIDVYLTFQEFPSQTKTEPVNNHGITKRNLPLNSFKNRTNCTRIMYANAPTVGYNIPIGLSLCRMWVTQPNDGENLYTTVSTTKKSSKDGSDQSTVIFPKEY